MKNTLLLATFLFTCSLYGQHWAPVSQTEKFNYRHPDSALISHSIWIDSLRVQGADSLFYLNKALKKCPECTPVRWVRNRGQFLQDVIRKKPGGVYVLEGARKNVLLTQAANGASWTFDTLDNTTATITAVQVENVFGVADSVKTIALSNGLSFKLSRSFGLLSFPETTGNGTYELLGIEGRNVGEMLPGSREMFDFEAGDVFQYDEEYTLEMIKRFTTAKYQVLERETLGDDLRYTFRRNMRVYYKQNNQTYGLSKTTDTISIVFAADTLPWLNDHPYQLEKVLEQSDHFDIYCPLRFFPHSTYGQTKELGSYSKIDGQYWGTLTPYLNYLSDTMTSVSPGFFHNDQRFAVGLGETFYFRRQGSQSTYRSLIGFVKNGDTTGIVYPDFSDLVDTMDVDSTSNNDQVVALTILGNPVKTQLELGLSMPSGSDGQLDIFAANGQLVYHETLAAAVSKKSIPASFFRAGVYFVRLECQNKRVVKKANIIP